MMNETMKYKKGLMETGAIIVKGNDEEPFRLKSGGESWIYVDHARVATDVLYFTAMVQALGGLVEDSYKGRDYSVMNVDSKISAQIVGAVSVLQKRDQVVFKGEKLLLREKGTKQQVTGEADRIAMMDDVGTSGRTLIEAGQVARDSLGNLQLNAFVALVREPDEFAANLAEEEINSYWLVTLDDALGTSYGGFSDSQKATLLTERGIDSSL